MDSNTQQLGLFEHQSAHISKIFNSMDSNTQQSGLFEHQSAHNREPEKIL